MDKARFVLLFVATTRVLPYFAWSGGVLRFKERWRGNVRKAGQAFGWGRFFSSLVSCGSHCEERTFGKAYRASCGHRKYGLLYEDLFIERPAVCEALRRLPDDLQQARLRRMKIASQCFVTQTEVERPVTEEEDVAYLSPYLAEVEREDFDRVAFWQ